MTRTINAQPIWEGNRAKVIEIFGAETVKMQGVGSGTYSVKGRLSSDAEYDLISLVKASDFSVVPEVTDSGIYIGDVTGYRDITVEASGFDKIYCVTVG